MDITELKSKISAEIDSKAEGLRALSRQIHANPEIGFREVKASGWISEYLEREGFAVERNYCRLPTAFKASYGQGKPVIGFLAEYDALPEIGHACGHNIIAAAAVGAALGAKIAGGLLNGTIQVVGTPAEELYSGKAILAERGGFNHLDAAMMVHPGNQDTAVVEALACHTLYIEFFGVAAHAASDPQAGTNALAAMILSFNNIDALRQHLPPKAMVHGIITDGGAAANVVPAHSAGNFIVRANTLATLEMVKQKILNCFSAAAVATGARLEYRWEEHYYAPVLNNLTLCKAYLRNLRQLGRKIRLQDPKEGFGSTDFGNVSHLVPGMHAQLGITVKSAVVHSPQFAEAAISATGLAAMLQAAKGLAMTAADLLASDSLLKKVKDEFAKK
ncbi:MAG TPA: M20 family metallopeptidase [Dehalococcoidales bacterium]|nr:M20 family metallopeptidase [Dehalococcoidales bacterium]